eukprot:451127_1
MNTSTMHKLTSNPDDIPYEIQLSTSADINETLADTQSPSSSSNSKVIKNKKWYYKISNWIRIIILLFISTILTFAIVKGDITVYIVKSFLEWVKTHIILGSFAFIGLYILCNLVMIPGFLLTVGAGYLFVNLLDAWYGIFIAIFIVCISRFLGWTFAFLAARYIFKSSVHSLMNKSQKLLFVNEVVKLKGFKVVFLLRLSPATPYGLLNYVMGVTSVAFKHYIMGHIGMIPDATLFCLVGASIASLSKLNETGIGSDKTVLIITIVLTVIAIIGIIYMGIVSKKELQKIAQDAKRNGVRLNVENKEDLVLETFGDNNETDKLEIGFSSSTVSVAQQFDSNISLS